MNIWWDSWSDFWAMGKHGVYVWGSYGVCALVVMAEVWQSRRARTQALREVRQSLMAAETNSGGVS
ncbi:MAG: heme exporter protein CcmD [Alphaproteobacteria bacterium]|nr:heme exporter protein CcmD [Alphaproteobacteria bacterium]